MIPVMVDWRQSDMNPGGALYLGNISHGGNPLAGVTTLRTARVHPEKITQAQGLLQIKRSRFIRQDVKAGTQGRLRYGKVEMIRGGYCHKFHTLSGWQRGLRRKHSLVVCVDPVLRQMQCRAGAG